VLQPFQGMDFGGVYQGRPAFQCRVQNAKYRLAKCGTNPSLNDFHAVGMEAAFSEKLANAENRSISELKSYLRLATHPTLGCAEHQSDEACHGCQRQKLRREPLDINPCHEVNIGASKATLVEIG
jgi:hypothetical protein